MIKEKHESIFKRPPESWGGGKAVTISFIVTEDCQLKCSYCFQHGKNKINMMTFDLAKNAVDYFLKDENINENEKVIFDFKGGEAFLEIDLVDKITEYIKYKMFDLNHKWIYNYRINFFTNGLLYSSKKVQEYIEKNKENLIIKISIDGNKEKHDLNRVFSDGSGSYEKVVKNIPLWLKQFPDAMTKVTISSDDIPFLKESILHLWHLGIKNVNGIVVFENVWKDGDDLKFENELIALADVIIENEYYKDYWCSFFTRSIGNTIPITSNFCGCEAGKKMFVVNYKGDIYPCNRLMDYSLANKKGRRIGDCFEGINLNLLRPYEALDRLSQSCKECIECESAGGCAICPGMNLDDAETDTIYQRAMNVCKIHKARVRANDYFWNRLKNEKGITE